jgi:hypothetical protein
MRYVLGDLKQKFPGFSPEKVVSILWVVEVFTSRKSTLMLHTHAKENRLRVRLVWAGAAIFTGLAMQC